MMIVNFASQCGFTSQYKRSQDLHQKYLSKGLAILGTPCNTFLGQEPGSDGTIDNNLLSELRSGVRNVCHGRNQRGEILRTSLSFRSLDTKPKELCKSKRNFEKLIRDRSGMVLARSESSKIPDAPALFGSDRFLSFCRQRS